MTSEFSTSKLGTCYERKFILKYDVEYHNILRSIRMKNGNKNCADCNSKDNSWCSVNIGVFLCINCAQIHRGVGTHISKVKSCMGTYLWHPDELEQMKTIGNDNASKIYGGFRNDGQKPNTRWVIQKYSK
tara:strand:- start:160 stop:549 length:390 start_codon:yes stop_codon:yes gene_type:complete